MYTLYSERKAEDVTYNKRCLCETDFPSRFLCNFVVKHGVIVARFIVDANTVEGRVERAGYGNPFVSSAATDRSHFRPSEVDFGGQAGQASHPITVSLQNRQPGTRPVC